MWKCVDDTTISEVVDKDRESCIQQVVFQLNERKCKKFRISFARKEPEFDPICVSDQTLETVDSMKLLGLHINSELKWNVLVSELVIRKVSTRLYFLIQLKKSRVATRELLLFYITCIRSILEYGSPVLHRALPNDLSKDPERLQKKIMKIIYPELSYANALELSRFLTLYHRREAVVAKLFEICANQCHILHKLPAKLLSGTTKNILFVQSVKLKDEIVLFL